MTPVFRFAPSPNGELHLGHAYSALTDFALCRAAGGRFLLRMEDIDPQRCRPEYEAQIYADLAWLGIEWEEPVRRQSDHMADYVRATDRLCERGLVYPSFMSRSEIAARVTATSPRDPDGAPLYPGNEGEMDEAVAAGEPHVLRLRMAEAAAMAGPLSWTETGEGPAGEHGTVAADPAIWGDFVVARREVPTSYHLAVVVDDALQGVTHVVRGRDLFHATAAHMLLQRLLGLPTPVYHHHRLVTDAAGRKLAKSSRDTSLRSLREAGVTVAEVKRMVGVEA
ncbi:MAG: tRNA glutamyl-Q(34) synthetase GluQRS [Rhizobiales bacterium]|nr:tRNA glutamyl-Q(34) synthetase GluQRS [Hyphomicrobiales bacterium]MBN9010191.1 tRNA glutamyl-Q(34) synthetase GluQRS [Hyphomicrobiales bacterium]